ncbi:hypothetical protein [Salmonella enterica]|uniref:hypothetical protein n=1 Tax=Salmonella enterica TaxID=28901 RepID=UPI0009B19BB8|nr:hypothetical protein [Salmonella enterica]
MTTIIREQQKQILIDTANHVISRDNTSPYSENLRELARIALASLDAETVRYLNKFSGTCVTLEQQPNAADDVAVYIPLYAAPPVPVVPEEISMASKLPLMSDQLMAVGYVKGWNACRAAMLQGKGESGKQVCELIMLVKRLASSLKSVNKSSKLPDKALEYLKRGLISAEDVLR